jgi:hypothetical protein
MIPVVREGPERVASIAADADDFVLQFSGMGHWSQGVVDVTDAHGHALSDAAGRASREGLAGAIQETGARCRQIWSHRACALLGIKLSEDLDRPARDDDALRLSSPGGTNETGGAARDAASGGRVVLGASARSSGRLPGGAAPAGLFLPREQEPCRRVRVDLAGRHPTADEVGDVGEASGLLRVGAAPASIHRVRQELSQAGIPVVAS